jgi:hypothetical protein
MPTKPLHLAWLLTAALVSCRESPEAPPRDGPPTRSELPDVEPRRLSADATPTPHDIPKKSIPLTFPAPIPFAPHSLGSELWRIFAMGPRHDLLAVATSDSLLLLDWPARTERWRRPLYGEPTHLAFSSDGRSLAVLTRPGRDTYISIFELSGTTTSPEKLELPADNGRLTTHPTHFSAAICEGRACGFRVKTPQGVLHVGTSPDGKQPSDLSWLTNQTPSEARGEISMSGTTLTRPDGTTVDLGCSGEFLLDTSFDRGALFCETPGNPLELRLLELSTGKALARHLLQTRPLSVAITGRDSLLVLTSPPSELGLLETGKPGLWQPVGPGGLVHDLSPDKTLAIMAGPSSELVEFTATSAETLCHHDVLGPAIAAGFEDDTTLWVLAENGGSPALSIARVLIHRDPSWPATRPRCTREAAFSLELSKTTNLSPRWVRGARAFLLPALMATDKALVLVTVGPSPEILRLTPELPTSLHVSPEGDLFGWLLHSAEVRLASTPSKPHLTLPNLASMALCGSRILTHASNEPWTVNSIHNNLSYAFQAPQPNQVACADDLLFLQTGGQLHAVKLTDDNASPIASWTLPEGSFDLPELMHPTRDGLLFSGGPTGLRHLALPRSEASKAP